MLRTRPAGTGWAIINLALHSNSTPPCSGRTANVDLFEDKATEGMVQVVNVTEVNLPANTVVLVNKCMPTISNDKTVNASDPSTWLLTIDGPCVSFRINKTDEELDCDRKNITFEGSKLTDYCKRSGASESVCKDSGVTPTSGVDRPTRKIVLVAVTIAALITSASV